LVDGVNLVALVTARSAQMRRIGRYSFYLLARKSCQIPSYVDRENAMSVLRGFLKDESGATAIEYGLIAACIALAIITAVKGVSNNLKSTFNNVSTNLR
jgi:pilus assembly protein Flp/PilA